MLSKVYAKNFQSWKELEFPITKGATLIDGWNEDDQTSEGSGKSAVLNAISWTIFGKIPKEANIDEVIKHGESSCTVILEFDNGDSIFRSRKPNDLFIKKSSGSVVKGKDAKETQELIEEYVGCNFETFCQSTYFAQNYSKKFLSSNQEEKGKILSSIQNLQIFDKARKEVMELLKLEENKIISFNNQIQIERNNITNFESQLGLITAFIQDKLSKHHLQVETILRHKENVSASILKTQQSLDLTVDQISKIDVDALTKDSQDLTAAKQEYQTTLNKIVYEKSQVQSIAHSILLKESEGRTLTSKYNNTLSKKAQLENINADSSYLRMLADKKKAGEFESSPSFIRRKAKQAELEAFIQNPTKNCPSCGTELKNIDVSHVQKELNGILFEMREASNRSSEDIETLSNKILVYEQEFVKNREHIDQELLNLMAQLESISEYLDQNKVPSMEQLISQESTTKDVIKQIDSTLAKIESDKIGRDRLCNIRDGDVRSITFYQQQLREYDFSLQKLGQPDVSEDQTKLTKLHENLSLTNERLNQVTDLKKASEQYTSRLSALKDGFKEIKTYVFANALNELNYRTNQYLNDLFEVEASIKFQNEDQKIESNVTIDGRSTSLGLLSGGQNRRFNLAVDLALSDIVSHRKTSKLDFLILDEYFKDLSEVSMEKCLNLLKSRKCPVILIEHNSIFKNIVDNTYFVKLTDGTSYESK